MTGLEWEGRKLARLRSIRTWTHCPAKVA